VDRGLSLDEVRFPYASPPHVGDYALLYTGHPVFEAEELQARFNANLLELPIRRDEAALRDFLCGAPAKLTSLYQRDRETVARVRNLLRQALPALPDFASVAARLHLSPRSLHRRLEEEGTRFGNIKNALRRDLALLWIAKTEKTIAEIAADLGYADTSAFYRAFVGWTGMAPIHYQRRLQERLGQARRSR
jgi:AraC-like DNA-binding protein